ncbi:hypothetical protein B0H17DRAFT_918435 [Mycena rosella]|uniref:Uncharacterized protein n=1 Tax=Mycena rosella TaxID=1033263 RepID=A0AAD7GWN5_MYCRO|nr:hypothetical protein B0H17DRAFT_918435 [Mycena rosella]
MPTTIRTFIQLLLRVIEISYPSHWVSDLLHSIIRDTLQSSWRPYQDAPIPASTIGQRHPHIKIQLGPWMADLEVLVASALQLFASPLVLPPQFPSVADTVVFSSKIIPLPYDIGYGGNPALALLFVAPGTNPKASGFTIHKLLLSRKSEGDNVQIVSSILTCDVDFSTRTGTVSWRMHTPRVESMKQAGWRLYLWRLDVSFIGQPLHPFRFTYSHILHS